MLISEFQTFRKRLKKKAEGKVVRRGFTHFISRSVSSSNKLSSLLLMAELRSLKQMRDLPGREEVELVRGRV